MSDFTQLQIQEKTQLLQWLRQKQGPVSETMLVHEFLALTKLNYFMLYQYLYELERDHLIMRHGKEYELTSLGGEMLDRVIDLFPNEPQMTAPLTFPTTTPIAGGHVDLVDYRYVVTLTLHQGDILRFSLTLDFPDQETADKTLARWIADPHPLYLAIHRQVEDWIDQP